VRHLAVLGVVGLALILPSTGATAAPGGPVHPGVQTFTGGAQCTSNFVFSDAGGTTYLGQAAHCSGTDGNTATNGCEAGSLPLGTPVEVDGATRPGTMVYNSWLAMQAAGEKDVDTCDYNDFALIRLDPADVGLVDPSVPHFGGPTGIRSSGLAFGDDVFTYGNSSLRFGLTQTSPKQGVSVGDGGSGWTHTVYTVTPGIPGDSGSGLLDSSGAAVGILSTVALAPLAGSNNFSDLAKTMAYAASHGGPAGLQLVTGGPFTGSLL
jgi:hypothetical protein